MSTEVRSMDITPREETGKPSCLSDPAPSPRAMLVARDSVDRFEARLSRPLAWPFGSL